MEHIIQDNEKHILLGGRVMNELYISDSSIYFKTNENTYDEAMDEFLSKCASAGIDIYIGNAALRDSDGNDVE